MLSVKLQVSSTCWIDPNFVLNTRFNFWPNLPIVSSFPAVFFIFFFLPSKIFFFLSRKIPISQNFRIFFSIFACLFYFLSMNLKGKTDFGRIKIISCYFSLLSKLQASRNPWEGKYLMNTGLQ